MDPIKQFSQEVDELIVESGKDKEFKKQSKEWMITSSKHKYSYQFRWMGRPIIQYPQDIIAMQEIIWEVKPDLIIECGVAHGGSLIFYASMLELIGDEQAHVIGIDIDIREHNRREIENHVMSKRITLIEGDSIGDNIIYQVHTVAKKYKKVMCILDSCHTDEHVWKEILAYSDLVTIGSYLVVFDTTIDDMPDEFFEDRPWKSGNSPRTALNRFLKSTDNFEQDQRYCSKLQISVCPDGYLKRIR